MGGGGEGFSLQFVQLIKLIKDFECCINGELYKSITLISVLKYTMELHKYDWNKKKENYIYEI